MAPAGGTIPPNGQQQVTVGVTTNGLGSGVYRGAITFSNQGSLPVQGSPQSVYVSLTVTPACTLTLSQGSLDFSGTHGGASPADQPLGIDVAQGCAASQTWTVARATSDGGNWLQVSSSRGTTPATVQVETNTSGLAPGTYSGTVTVTNRLGSKSLNVTLTVTPVPCKVSGPGALASQGTAGQSNPIVQGAKISTSGDCQQALDWTGSVSSGGSWLHVSASGTLTSSATVDIQSNLASLSAGTYHGSVTITVVDSATNQTVGTIVISVTLTVVPPPPPPQTPCSLQAASSSALGFTAAAGANPTVPARSVTISVTGSCAGDVTITPTVDAAASGWLSVTGPVTIASGSTATFTVTVTAAAQVAGIHTGTITLVASGGISGSPRAVTVTLTVQ